MILKKTLFLAVLFLSLLLLCACGTKKDDTAPISAAATETVLPKQAAEPSADPPASGSSYLTAYSTVPDPAAVCGLEHISSTIIRGLECRYYEAPAGEIQTAFTDICEQYAAFCEENGLIPDDTLSSSQCLYVPCGDYAILLTVLTDSGCIAALIGTAQAFSSNMDSLLPA